VTAQPAAKPTTSDLGIDLTEQSWQRSGTGDGAIEIAFVPPGTEAQTGGVEPAAAAGTHAAGSAAPAQARSAQSAPAQAEPARIAPDAAPGQWVLMRVAGDPEGRVLVFDRNEWECFLDGARNGEFDDAAGPSGPRSR
jgi:hypothetical protein